MTTDQQILEKSILGHTEETIRIVEDFDEGDIAAFIESLPFELAVVVLSKMTRFMAVRIVEKVDQKTASMLIERLPISVAKVILWQLDESLSKRILADIPSQTSKSLNIILQHPKNTVGAYVDPLVFTLHETDTVADGLEKIKKYQHPVLQQVFILGQDQSIAGVIELKQLIINDGKVLVRSIMNTDYKKIKASTEISVLKNEQWWSESFPYLPVVDRDEIFLGVVTKKMLADISPDKSASYHQALQAGAALGDLYRVGLNSFLRGEVK